MCMIVIEKQERVDTNVVLAFQLLDETLVSITYENLFVIFTKTTDADDYDSVLEFYGEAREQAKCKNLPIEKTITEECVILLER